MSDESPLHSALHASLGLTDQELRLELSEAGLNPDDEHQAIRVMFSRAVERAASQPETQRRIIELLQRF